MSKRSLEIEPNSSSFLDTYAWILFKQAKYKDAKEYQEKAINASNEDRTTLYEHFGDILFHLNDIEKAVDYWKQAQSAGNKSDLLRRKINERKYYAEEAE
jgi:tetratricopeptide (TPR) repeat protein